MRWLSVDPGETVGWALWEDEELIDSGQHPLVEFRGMVAAGLGVGYMADYLAAENPGPFEGVKRLVIERFALYPWVIKSGGLDFDEVRTARLIGALEFIAYEAGVEVVFQAATIKEPALMGGAAELFNSPRHEMRHSNDAIMHGWFYVMTEMRGVKIKLPSGSTVKVDPTRTVSDRGDD